MRLAEFLKPAVDMDAPKVWSRISLQAKTLSDAHLPSYDDKALHFILEHYEYRIYIIQKRDSCFDLALVRRKTFVHEYHGDLFCEDLSAIISRIGKSRYFRRITK